MSAAKKITEDQAFAEEMEAVRETGLPTAAQVVDQEYDLLESLLKASEYKEDESLQRTIRIERNGNYLFSFRVRPISEEDLKIARKKSTSYMKNPAGKNLPPIEKETDYPMVRNWKIYLSTVEEDRAKIWDNKTLKDKFDLIQGAEMVDKLLTGGEKNAVSDVIDTLSGYDLDLTEYAKN